MKSRHVIAEWDKKSNLWLLRVEQTTTNDLTGEVEVLTLWQGQTDVADPKKHVLHARDKYKARSFEIRK